MKKQLLSICALLVCAVLFFAQLPAASFAEDRPPVTLTVSDGEGVRGDVVMIYISISGNKGINGMQFRVKFDPTMLAPDSSETRVIKLSQNSAVNYGEDYVEFIATSLTPYRLQNNIAVVAFELLAPGQTQVSLEFDETRGDCIYYLDGNDMVDLQYSTVPGTVTTAFSPESDFYYELSCAPTPINENARVTVTMHNPPDEIYGFSLEVLFDPAKIAFVEGESSEFFPWGRAVCLEQGRARVFAASQIDSPATVDRLMAELVFEVIDPDKAVGSTYDFTIAFYNNQPAYTLDENRKTKVISDVYTVGTTLTLTESSAPALPFDLDGDGTVAIGDVTALLDALSGNASAIVEGKSADVDLNGVVDIGDVTALLDLLATAGQ